MSVGSILSRSQSRGSLQMSKPQPRNGNAVFDPKAFLARAGVGRKILSLKKMRWPSRKATLPTLFFMCRRAN